MKKASLLMIYWPIVIIGFICLSFMEHHASGAPQYPEPWV